MEDDDYSSTTDSSSESTTTTPAASAGILMLSLPDSFDEDEPHNDNDDKSSGDHDVFETPPEYALVGISQEKTPVIDLDHIGDDDDENRGFEGVGGIGDGSGVIVAVGEEVDGALDLGRDSDLVVSQKELMEFRVSKRDLASTAESSPPSKKLRVLDHDSGESDEELETERLSLSNLGSDSDHTLEIAGDDVKDDEKSGEEISGKKSVKDSGSDSENADEDTQPITEESGGQSSVELSYQEGGDTGDSQVFRVLPLSFWPSVEPSEKRAEEGNKWSFLLDVLKLLKEKAGEECDEIEKCSFVEIAKRRGVAFPRL